MMSNEEFENSLKEINRKLDEIDIGLAMNAEAIESIGLSLMFLKTELEFEEERDKNDYWA